MIDSVEAGRFAHGVRLAPVFYMFQLVFMIDQTGFDVRLTFHQALRGPAEG
jgi:hypothetical protein